MKYIFEVNMMVPVRFEVAANTPREAMKKLFEMNNYNCWESSATQASFPTALTAPPSSGSTPISTRTSQNLSAPADSRCPAERNYILDY